MIDREQLLAVIRRVQAIREEADAVMELLVPDDQDGECRHHPHLVEDESTMGEPLYRCKCGATSPTPLFVEHTA